MALAAAQEASTRPSLGAADADHAFMYLGLHLGGIPAADSIAPHDDLPAAHEGRECAGRGAEALDVAANGSSQS